MPIFLRAGRMDAAEDSSKEVQSTSAKIASSFGAANLALRPKCPKHAATHARTESSWVSRRDAISVTVASSTFLLFFPLVISARCSAASVRAFTDAPPRTWAIVSFICWENVEPLAAQAVPDNNRNQTMASGPLIPAILHLRLWVYAQGIRKHRTRWGAEHESGA